MVDVWRLNDALHLLTLRNSKYVPVRYIYQVYCSRNIDHFYWLSVGLPFLVELKQTDSKKQKEISKVFITGNTGLHLVCVSLRLLQLQQFLLAVCVSLFGVQLKFWHANNEREYGHEHVCGYG